MKERYNWIRGFNRSRLTVLHDEFNAYIKSPDFEKDTSAFLEYYLISYGLSPSTLTVFREKYLVPQLVVLKYVPKKSQAAFLHQLEQHIRAQLKQEIFLRKLFAFVFQKIRDNFINKIIPENDEDSLNNLARIYLNTDQILKKHLSSAEVVKSQHRKQELLTDLQEDTFSADDTLKPVTDTLAFYRNSTASGTFFGMMASVLVLGALNYIPPLLDALLLLLLYMMHSLYLQDNEVASDQYNFKETLKAISGSDKFQMTFNEATLSYFQGFNQHVDSLLNAVKDKIYQEKIRAAIPSIELTRDNTLSESVALGVTLFNHESSQPALRKAPRHHENREESLAPSIIPAAKSVEERIISWKINDCSISFNPSVYTEQIVELWTLNRGLMYLNNTFFVYWDPDEIRRSIHAIRKKDVEDIFDEFSLIGQTGHIVTHEGKSGYVDCKGQNEDYRFKIKSLMTYATFRIYFKPIGLSQSGKILLGEPQLRLDH